jgi:hypothetical protein
MGSPRVLSALVLAMLVQRWELSPVPGFKLRLAPAITLRPAPGGVPVHIRRRTVSTHRALESARVQSS